MKVCILTFGRWCLKLTLNALWVVDSLIRILVMIIYSIRVLVEQETEMKQSFW